MCLVSASAPDLVSVRLLDVPVPLRFRSMEHGDGLLREMTLLTMSDATAARVPKRLVELAAEVTNGYGAFTAGPTEQLEQARARGLEFLPELEYRLPRQVGEFARELRSVLHEVDEFCRAGEHLLTLAAPPDIAAYRTWTLTEVERQIEGEPPVPWPDYWAAHQG